MSVFRIGGIASGIDFNNIVDQLMLLERRPITLMESKKQLLSWKKDFWSDIKTALSNLNASTQTLLKPSTMMACTTSTTDEKKVTATATSSAAIATYTVNVNNLATSTVITGGDGDLNIGVGGKIDAGAAVSSYTSKFNTHPTEGTFTVNGVIFELLDSDDDGKIDRIEVDSAGAGYSLDNASGITLNDIITAFNNEDVRTAAGLRASIDGDAAVYDSATDKFTLNAAAAGSLNLSSGGDTSNFLTAVSLLNASGTTSKTSVSHLGALRLSQPLSDANLSVTGGLTTDANGTGKFKINGVEITFNKNTDSMQSIINRINSSTAGVIATYDSIQDRLVLTNKNTGSTGITRESVSGYGNFLTAVDLLTGATEALGSNASLTISGVNGGNTIYSQSNDVSGVVAGVTFNLKAATDVGSPVTITVNQDKTKIKTAVKDFVDKYNAVISLINSKLSEEKVKDAKSDTDKKKGLLRGDRVLIDLKMKLVNQATSAVSGLPSTLDQLYEIGITLSKDNFGKANTLVLDETKLDEKLNENPAAVANLFFKDTDGDGKVDTGEVGVAARLSTYMDSILATSGSTKVTRTEDKATTDITYSGSWSSVSDTNASGSGFRQSSTSGDYAEFTFTGSKVVWYATKDSDKGIAKVYIDGVYKTDIDLYSSSAEYAQAVYTADGLSSGSHTIKIEVTSNKNASSSGYNISVDSLDVTSTSSPGAIIGQQNALQGQMDSIKKSIDLMEQRLTKREETLIKQFTAMEKSIQRLQDSFSRMQSQLSSMMR